MLGIITLTVFSPVFLSLNTQGLLEPLLKDVSHIAEQAIGKVETTVTEGITTYSDNNYQTKTTNFSPGQTIYLQVKTNIDGTTKKSVDLLDSNKNKISSYELNKSSNNPFIYTQSFPAPNTSGIYYLDMEIRSGESSVYKGEQNINIGNTNGSVKSESTAQVTASAGRNVQSNNSQEQSNNSQEKITDQASPQATPQMSPQIAGDSGKNIASIPARMNEFFTLLDTILTNLQKLFVIIMP
jgi:hypothetical protein